MRFLKVILLFLFVVLFSSCAERYSSRKRTGNRVEEQEGVSRKKSQPVIARTSHEQKNRKQKTDELMSEKEAVAEKVTAKTAFYAASEQQQLVLDTALSYLGSPYKYGGTTRAGFDCSGFVSAAFQPLEISLHRSSHEMANQGKHVDLKNVQVGDLLFFVTGKNKRISHVGIVVENEKEIKFIHSSTSRGVIISSMNEGYWSKAYRKARRVM